MTVSVQRSILLDPGASDSSRFKGGDSTESLELIASLRATTKEQMAEINDLRQRLVEMAGEQDDERQSLTAEASRLVKQVAFLQAQLAKMKEDLEHATRYAAVETETANSAQSVNEAEKRARDAEKEQEDLLVLLEEISNKRKADKSKMRSAGLEVSDDDEEEEEEENDEKET